MARDPVIVPVDLGNLPRGRMVSCVIEDGKAMTMEFWTADEAALVDQGRRDMAAWRERGGK